MFLSFNFLYNSYVFDILYELRSVFPTSFCLPDLMSGYFFDIGPLVFSKSQRGDTAHVGFSVTELESFKKIFLGKNDQKWSKWLKNGVLLLF